MLSVKLIAVRNVLSSVNCKQEGAWVTLEEWLCFFHSTRVYQKSIKLLAFRFQFLLDFATYSSIFPLRDSFPSSYLHQTDTWSVYIVMLIAFPEYLKSAADIIDIFHQNKKHWVERLFNEVVGITNGIHRPSNGKNTWKRTPAITKPRYSDDSLPVPWSFVISRFHSIIYLIMRNRYWKVSEGPSWTFSIRHPASILAQSRHPVPNRTASFPGREDERPWERGWSAKCDFLSVSYRTPPSILKLSCISSIKMSKSRSRWSIYIPHLASIFTPIQHSAKPMLDLGL